MDRPDWPIPPIWTQTASLELWLAVVYVLSLFAVTTFRPQQIGSVGLFRLSYILFTLYLIIPSIVNMVIAIIQADRRNLGRLDMPTPVEQILIPVFQSFAKLLFAIALLCALSSLRHYQRRDLPPVLDDR